MIDIDVMLWSMQASIKLDIFDFNYFLFPIIFDFFVKRKLEFEFFAEIAINSDVLILESIVIYKFV